MNQTARIAAGGAPQDKVAFSPTGQPEDAYLGL